MILFFSFTYACQHLFLYLLFMYINTQTLHNVSGIGNQLQLWMFFMWRKFEDTEVPPVTNLSWYHWRWRFESFRTGTSVMCRPICFFSRHRRGTILRALYQLFGTILLRCLWGFSRSLTGFQWVLEAPVSQKSSRPVVAEMPRRIISVCRDNESNLISESTTALLRIGKLTKLLCQYD